jgi:hypothetical protein
MTVGYHRSVNSHFAVHNGNIFTVTGNKISVYDATTLDHDKKPEASSQHIMTDYPEDHDNECVFAVTSNGKLVTIKICFTC